MSLDRGGCSNSEPRIEEKAHSLHIRGETRLHDPLHGRKSGADRFLVGLAAGAALFYVVGRAVGLGRHSKTHSAMRS